MVEEKEIDDEIVEEAEGPVTIELKRDRIVEINENIKELLQERDELEREIEYLNDELEGKD